MLLKTREYTLFSSIFYLEYNLRNGPIQKDFTSQYQIAKENKYLDRIFIASNLKKVHNKKTY